MTTSHNNTLLAQMGFADKDRKNSRHDLACQYFAQVAKTLFPEDRVIKVYAEALVSEKWEKVGYSISKPGRTLGFADAVLHVKWEEQQEDGKWDREGTSPYPNFVPNGTFYKVDKMKGVLVEVKITRESLGDVLRQLNLYKSGAFFCELYEGQRPQPLTFDETLLVTDYDLNAEDLIVLKNADIQHLRLGPGFDTYIAARKSDAPVVQKMV